jgi:cellulose synthase/poly-beta-1,6-N-acetylglucosamine synthase-like glycosyltransferase
MYEQLEEQQLYLSGQTDVIEQRYPRVSVVIPARNEARNLKHVLPYLPPIITEVILVDGHSSDDK